MGFDIVFLVHFLGPAVVSPLQARLYHIYNINCPIDMIPRGVRDYIVRQMSGRSIEGNVRRGRNSNTGEQLVILSITANDATFSDIEGSILNSDMWDYMTVHSEPRQTFSHRNFRILPSWNGTIR
jgi:hypothetical protein